MGCEPGQHRFEWHREKEGMVEYVCMNENCGEVMTQYIDTQGG
jgi:hypothetical protein